MKDNQLIARLAKLKNENKKAIILFTTVGDPTLDVTREFLWFCQNEGVDCVELGIPFSDPLADGPIIQASSYRSVQKNISLQTTLDLVRKERHAGLKIPIVFMSSLNPIYHYGVDKAAKAMKDCGVDGAILPDLPFAEDLEIEKAFKKHKVPIICMTTPATPKTRHKDILKAADGFIYYVSLIGLTGGVKRSKFSIEKHVKLSKKISNAPIFVGFGVSEPKQAKAACSFSDGVIIGSAIVNNLYQYSKSRLSGFSKNWIRSFIKEVKNEK